MGGERLPKRVMFEGLKGGQRKGYFGRQEQDSKGCLERDLSLFNLLIEEKQWTLAAKKPSERFRPVEEAGEQQWYMKRWFVKAKGNVAKRRPLEAQYTQRLNQDAVGPKARGRGEEPR